MFKTGSWLSLLALMAPAHGSVPSLKVLIGKSLKNVVVEGTDLRKTIHTQKRSLQYQGRKTIAFNCDPSLSKVKVAYPKSPLLVASLSSPTGLVSWGTKKYQGELHLVTNPVNESCDLINHIPMEDYITTLLAKEMNGTWPVEALKAQAVAARTYAYDRLKGEDKLFHIESSEKDQVSGSFMDITRNTLKASRDTEGEVLVGPSGRISPVFFHSKCGGRTLRPDQVWGGIEEGYRSVDCPFCQKTGMKNWDHKIKNRTLNSMVDKVLNKYYSDKISDSAIKLMPDSPENSELRLYAGERLHIIKKSYLRSLFGRNILPSNNFVMTQKGDVFHVEGKGYGHGVGMCQLGALELAKRGYNYRQILSHYFPRHKMKKIY